MSPNEEGDCPHQENVDVQKREPTGDDGQEDHVTWEDTEGELTGREVNEAVAGPDIDKGWAWMVCLSCFIANFIVDGVIFSFGVLLLSLLEYFDETRSKTAWVGSSLVGTCMFMGPAVSLLLEFFSCRQVMILGSLISTAGFFFSVFSLNIETLIFTFGVLGGAGFGLTFITAILAVGLHFNTKRALATGIATSGSGLGTFAISYLSERVVISYGWQGSVLITAGIVCNLLVCAALVRPLVKEPSNIFSRCTSYFVKNGRHRSTTSIPPEKVPLHSESCEAPPPVIRVSEGLDNTPPNIHVPRTKVLSSVDRLIVTDNQLRLSRSIEQMTSKCDTKVRRYQSDFHLHSLQVQGNNPKTLQEIFGHPLHRKDIFYSGSLYNLPEYQRDPNMVSFLINMASFNSSQNQASREQSLAEKESSRRGLILQAYKDLITDGRFLMLLVTMVCWTGQGTAVMFLPDLAVSRGVSTMQAALLVSIVGGTNILGRLIAGWLANRKNIDSVLIYACALLLDGLSSALMPFCSSFALFVVCSCVFGLCMGGCVSLRTIVLADVLGISKLTKSFGIVAFVQGFAFIVGPPISGALYDHTQSYLPPYLLTAAVYTLGMLTCVCIRSVEKCLKKSRRRCSD
ncbi:monocarboxylate transporter 9-like [Liolophura sinensis]|uniref:monocarboxylate transporter 9-like n=1 Tax=Liolophura sinensis TaxID=3198878 RepID=UPI0031598430